MIDPKIYARAVNKDNSEISGFIRSMQPHGNFGDFDTNASRVLADFLEDRGHPLAHLFRQQPRRIYNDDLNSRRGGPGGRMAYFRPLAVENGFLWGLTGTGLTHDFAGIQLHAIPINPDHKGRTQPTLTRQALGSRLLPYEFSTVLGHTATKELAEKLPEGGLKTSLSALLTNGDKTFKNKFDNLDETKRPQNPQTDSEHHAAIHFEPQDDTHADNYAKWLESQGDPMAEIVAHHLRNNGGSPGRKNQRSSLYSNYAWIDHRGGKIGVGPPRMWNGRSHVDVEFAVPHPQAAAGEEYPRHPNGHLVPAWLYWRKYMPVDQVNQLADRLPSEVGEQMKAVAAKTAEPEGD